MRILYHHRTLGDGAEGIHIAAMVSAFEGLGHEVSVSGLTPASSVSVRQRVLSKVRSTLPRVFFEIAAAGYGAVEHVSAVRAIDRVQPDLVYARHARFDVATLAAARRLGVPSILEVNCVYTSPDYEQFEPHAIPHLVRTFERRSVELATLVVAVSTPLARAIQALGRADVAVIPNGADPIRFDPRLADGSRVRSRHGLGSALTVGWAGILREWHGLHLLLDAVATQPDLRLLVVGDGPARPALEQRAQELGIRDRVVITGRVSHQEMPDYISAMDIAVVADERTGVASPMKLLEYMAMARPVVAPAKDNIKDLLDDGVDGLLFEPGRADRLAGRLHELVTNPQLRSDLGAAARQKVEREHNWTCVAQEILKRSASLDPAHREARD